MKNSKITLILFIVISITSFIKCSKANENNLPEASFIPFEKQEVVGYHDWSLVGPSGDQKNLIADQGNVMLIHLWEANGSNLEELEIFQKVYDEYKTKMQFYFVTEDSQLIVRKFYEEHNFNFPIFYSMSPIPVPMKSDQKPFTYLINKKGRIIVAQSKKANWNSNLFKETLDKILK